VGVEAEFPLQDSIIVSRGGGNRVSLIRFSNSFLVWKGQGLIHIVSNDFSLSGMWGTLYSWQGRFLGILDACTHEVFRTFICGK
jgi:hypothetical protein